MPSNTDMPSTITVRSVDYGNAREARALVELLDGYARDVAGGGVPLSAEVQRGWRGHRIAQRMLHRVEALAHERGACKLTLEVLSGNHSAMRAYEREGFAAYTLDPSMGQAQFLQKMLDGAGPAPLAAP